MALHRLTHTADVPGINWLTPRAGTVGTGQFHAWGSLRSLPALQPEHDELISRAANAGAGVLIRGAVARGTASEDKNWTVQPLSSSGPPAQDRWAAAKLDELLEDGMSRHEFILRFTLSHPGVSSAIVGTGKLGHLRANVAAASRGPLPEDVYAEAQRRLAAA